MHIFFTDVLSTYGFIIFILVTALFVLAVYKKDNSIMDIAYGPLFFVAGLFTTLTLGIFEPLPLLILLAIFLWALRLSSRIYRKNAGQPEDARYATWRTAWSARSRAYFLLRSYLQVFILQGAIITIVSTPLLMALSFSATALNPLVLGIGLLVFITGLTIETIADRQLDAFIARKKASTESAPLMTSGLFRYSRRPNYFGESLIWFGLAIMVLPVPYGYLALISPITITYIVTKVTGPMLEAIFLAREPEAYRAYMAKTSYFIPLPPRK